MKYLVFGLLFSQLGWTQVQPTYDLPFVPDLYRSLGSGYDGINHQDKFDSCIEYEEKNLDNSSNIQTTLRSSFVKSSQEIIEKLDIASSLSVDVKLADLMKGDAKISGSYNKYFKMNEDEIALMIWAQQDHGRIAARNVRLKEKYQKILDSDKEEFVRLCGTHYVAMENKRSVVMALVKIKDLSETAKQEIILKYSQNLEMSAISLSSSFTFDYSKFFQEISRVTSVKIEFFSLGGNGIKDISTLLSSADSTEISKILSGISEYAKGIEANSAPTLKYIATVYPELKISNIDLTQQQLQKMRYWLSHIEKNNQKVIDLNKSKHEDYSQWMASYLIDQSEVIASLVKKCLFEKDCPQKKFPGIWVATDRNFIKEMQVDVNCSYEYFENEKERKYLSSINLIFSGDVFFPDDIGGIKVIRENDKGAKVIDPNQMGGSPKWGMLREINQYGTTAESSTLAMYIENDHANHTRVAQRIPFTFENVEKSRQLRDRVLSSRYWLKMQNQIKDNEVLIALPAVSLKTCPEMI